MTTDGGIFMVDPTREDFTSDINGNGVIMRGGSQKSRPSIGTISIFTDPNAAKEMAGDAEVTYTYDTTTEGEFRRVSPTLMNGGVPSIGGSSTTSSDQQVIKRSSSVKQIVALSSADEKLKQDVPSTTVKKENNSSHVALNKTPPRKQATVRKAGSFQMKSSYSGSSVVHSSSSTATQDRPSRENSLSRHVEHVQPVVQQNAGSTVVGGDGGSTNEESLENKTGETTNTLDIDAYVSTMDDFDREINTAFKDEDDFAHPEIESSKPTNLSQEVITRSVNRGSSSRGEITSKHTSTTSNMSASGSNDVLVTTGDKSSSANVSPVVYGNVTPVMYRSRDSVAGGVARTEREPETVSGASSKHTSLTAIKRQPGSYRMPAPSGNDIGKLTSNETNRSESVGKQMSPAEEDVRHTTTEATKVPANDAVSGSLKPGSDSAEALSSSESITHDMVQDFMTETTTDDGFGETTSGTKPPGSYHMSGYPGDSIGRLDLKRNDISRSGSFGVSSSRAQGIAIGLMADSPSQADGAGHEFKSVGGHNTQNITKSNESMTRDYTTEIVTAKQSESKPIRSDELNMSSTQNIVRKLMTDDGEQSGNGSLDRSSATLHARVTSADEPATVSQIMTEHLQTSRSSNSQTTVNIAAREMSPVPPGPSERSPTDHVKNKRPPGRFRTNISSAYQDITSESTAGVQRTAISRSQSGGGRQSLDGRGEANHMALMTESTQALGTKSISGVTLAESSTAVRRPTELSLSPTGSRASNVSGSDSAGTMVVSPSVVQNAEFKAKLSTLVGGLSPLSLTSASSQPSSLDRRTRPRTEQTGEFAAADDSMKGYSTVPRDNAGNKPVAWTSPTSPVYEVQELVRDGTVDTLVKDVFKNMQLTGGCLDSSSLKKRERGSTSVGTTPTSAEFKFPIEGIDTPSAEPASFEADTRNEQNDVDEGTTSDSADALRQDLARRGFRPIIDMKMAGEIKKKAQDLTARRPHEAVETKFAEQRQLKDLSEPQESELLRQTREKLHKQVLEVGLSRTIDTSEVNQDVNYGVVLRNSHLEREEDMTMAESALTRPETKSDSSDTDAMGETIADETAMKGQEALLHRGLYEFPANKAALSSSENNIAISQAGHAIDITDSDIAEPERTISTSYNTIEFAPIRAHATSTVNSANKSRDQTIKDKSANPPVNDSLRSAMASSKTDYSTSTGQDKKSTVESIDRTAAEVTTKSEQPFNGMAFANETKNHSRSYHLETVTGDRVDGRNDKTAEQQHRNQQKTSVKSVEIGEQTDGAVKRDYSYRQIDVIVKDDVAENSVKLSTPNIDGESTLSNSGSVTEQHLGDHSGNSVINTILASGVLLSNEPPRSNVASSENGLRVANERNTTGTQYWETDSIEKTRTHRLHSGGLNVDVHNDSPQHSITYNSPKQWTDSSPSTPRRSAASSSGDESAGWVSAVRVRHGPPHTQRQQQRPRSPAVTRGGRDVEPPRSAQPLPLEPLTIQVNTDGQYMRDVSLSPYMYAAAGTPLVRDSRSVSQRGAPPRGYKPVITQGGDGGLRDFVNDYNGYYYECEHLQARQPPAVVAVNYVNMRDGTRSSSTTTRYLRVDESHTGRTPVRRHSARSRPVNYVRLDGTHPSDFETHAAYNGNEPVYRYKPTSGKYMVQRAMQDRIISSPPHHPDMRYRDQTSYTLNGAESLGDLQSIDPELRDANKRGDNYHITLNLKNTGTPSRPGSRASRYADETQIKNSSSLGYVNGNAPYREVIQSVPVHQHSVPVHQPDGYGDVIQSVPVHQQSVRVHQQSAPPHHLDGYGDVAVTREERIYAVQHVSPRVHTDGGYTVTRVHSEGITPPPPLMNIHNSNSSSNGLQVQQAPSHYANGFGGAPKANFSMQINQTMTMGYKPTEQQTPTQTMAQVSSAPKYVVKSVTETRRQDLERMMVNGNSRRLEDELEQYPVEEYHQTYRRNVDDLPQVVRGNILIKNSIDTTGAARVVDVVEADDSDEIVVEDNVNPFHGQYFQSRENPMYSSDQDLSRVHRESSTTVHRRPSRQLDSMFDDRMVTSTRVTPTKERPRKNMNVPIEWGEDDYETEINVTRAAPMKSTPRKNRNVPIETGEDGFDTEIQVTRGRWTLFVMVCCCLLILQTFRVVAY